MSKEGKVDAHGIKSPYQSTYTYKWDGVVTLASSGQTHTIVYQSLLGDVVIGDYANEIFGWLKDKPRNTNYQGLSIKGIIRSDDDSSFFNYSLVESGLSLLSDGFLLYRQDTMFFKPIYSEVRKGTSVRRVSHGYGVYAKDSLLAAADFAQKPNSAYIRKELPKALHGVLVSYLCIAAGNQKIIARRSTALKRFY